MRRIFQLFTFALAAALLVAPAARSASSDMVVSQVYAGGGNSGATFANDFVEIFNRGTTAIDLGTWSIQYASAAGTSWQATALSGSVQPGRYYLIQLASAAAVGSALPTPDATAPATSRSRAGRSRSCGARHRSRAARRPGAAPATLRSRIWSGTAPLRTTRVQKPLRR